MSLLFIVQLSVSIGALAITTDQQKDLLRTAWNKAALSDKEGLQQKLDCCGFESYNFTVGPRNPSCSKVSYHCTLFVFFSLGPFDYLKGVQRPACFARSQRLALHSFQSN